MSNVYDAVVCGAGIAGTACACHLAKRAGLSRVAVVDPLPPLSLTSNKGTQGYRNWWPGPDSTMLRFVSRSIDIMEDVARESGNAVRMSRRGYLFIAQREQTLEQLRQTAHQVAGFGMGEVREFPSAREYIPAPADGFDGLPDGADLLDASLTRRVFPYVAPDVAGALHVRRAGFLSAVAMGNWSLTRAMAAGAHYIRDSVTAVHTANGSVRGVRLASGQELQTERLVIAAGPMLGDFLRMLDVELPIAHELHARFTMRDTGAAVARNAPFLIWSDAMRLDWSSAERAGLEETAQGRRLLDVMPGGVHVRPVDASFGDELYLIWTYHTEQITPVWPPAYDTCYAQAVLRGAARMIPGMARYDVREVGGVVDGGYYCKAPDNRPLVGPLDVAGAFVCAALSGSGVMSSHAAAELAVLHMTDSPLPDYASAFVPARLNDPEYVKAWKEAGSLTGQL